MTFEYRDLNDTRLLFPVNKRSRRLVELINKISDESKKAAFQNEVGQINRALNKIDFLRKTKKQFVAQLEEIEMRVSVIRESFNQEEIIIELDKIDRYIKKIPIK